MGLNFTPPLYSGDRMKSAFIHVACFWRLRAHFTISSRVASGSACKASKTACFALSLGKPKVLRARIASACNSSFTSGASASVGSESSASDSPPACGGRPSAYPIKFDNISSGNRTRPTSHSIAVFISSFMSFYVLPGHRRIDCRIYEVHTPEFHCFHSPTGNAHLHTPIGDSAPAGVFGYCNYCLFLLRFHLFLLFFGFVSYIHGLLLFDGRNIVVHSVDILGGRLRHIHRGGGCHVVF